MVIDVAVGGNESEFPVMQLVHRNVYDMCVELMNVLFAIGDSDKLALV